LRTSVRYAIKGLWNRDGDEMGIDLDM